MWKSSWPLEQGGEIIPNTPAWHPRVALLSPTEQQRNVPGEFTPIDLPSGTPLQSGIYLNSWERKKSNDSQFGACNGTDQLTSLQGRRKEGRGSCLCLLECSLECYRKRLRVVVKLQHEVINPPLRTPRRVCKRRVGQAGRAIGGWWAWADDRRDDGRVQVSLINFLYLPACCLMQGMNCWPGGGGAGTFNEMLL